MSPYKDGGNNKIKYVGQPIVPKGITQVRGNHDNTQLKVLNLDRLFRRKQGVLTNVVPIPAPKLQAVTARKSVLKTIRKRDKIHDIIEEYNRLVHIMTLGKIKPKIGIRGRNFTQTPTLEDLMGIKQKPVIKVLGSES